MAYDTQLQTAEHTAEFLMPTYEDVRVQVQQSQKSKSERRSPADYLRVPPPEGAKDWRGASVGSTNSVAFWLAPMYAPGRFGHGERSHFVKTSRSPNGTNLLCAGKKCLLCAAWFAFKDQCDEDTKAKLEFCKRRYSTQFNVINLSDPGAQVYDDGTRHPLIASFSSTVAKMLYEILDEHGPGICHPQTGRGLRWKKRKDGERMTEVSSYLTVLPQEPLPRDLWDLCRPQNLWQLHEISESLMPSPEEQAEVLSDLGLPVVRAPGLPEVSAVAAFDRAPSVPAIAASADIYTEGRRLYQAKTKSLPQPQSAQPAASARQPAPAARPAPARAQAVAAAQVADEGPAYDDVPMPEEYFGPPLDESPEEAPWDKYRNGPPQRSQRGG